VCAVLLACSGPPPGPPVVGVAYPPWVAIYVAVAESTLRRTWGDTATIPRFVFDTVEERENVERSVEWSRELVHVPGLAVVVGPSASHIALATAPIFNAAAVPQLLPTVTNDRVDQAGPWTFRLAADDSAQGTFLIREILARPALRKVLVLYTNDAYGQGLRAGLHAAAQGTGLSITAEIPVDPQSDFELLLRPELDRRPPDVIIGAFRTTELLHASTALAARRSRIPLFIGDGAFDPGTLHRIVPSRSFEIYGASFWYPDTTELRDREFVELFTRIVGRPPAPEHAMIHDALILAATAARHGPEPVEIRRWLLSLTDQAPVFVGVTGPIVLEQVDARPYRLGRFVGAGSIPAERP
jgi:ABC-type branched-subunit amino acid transport system substrate-binding protein